jgi:hypothetical protein
MGIPPLAKGPPPEMPRANSSAGSYRPIWLAMTAAAWMVLSLPTMVLVGFGMMPTIVAYIIDQTEQKNATFCVGSINFCGIFPYVIEIWAGDHTIDQSFDILSNVFKLFVIFGSAGIGWLIYSGIPPMVSTMLLLRAEHRLEQLKDIQQELVIEWGPEVAQPSRGAATPPGR